MNNTELKGYWGEFFSILLLKLKGYKILAHRYKTKVGEIDIIAQKRDTIIFVEVKSRKNEEKCIIAITQKQLHRIQNASQIFLQNNPALQECFSRYDVILVSNWKFPIHLQYITM